MATVPNLYTTGVDEAGRGPLAGPVFVGVVVVTKNFNNKFWKGIRDSKRLSEKARKYWFNKIKSAQKKGKLIYKVSQSHSKTIDQIGIVSAIQKSVNSCLDRINISPKKMLVLLDGSLKAPSKYSKQKTVIRGDERIQIISAASIMAKVSRDRAMVRFAKKYPVYNFNIHKGYGTDMHYKKLREFGPSLIHRKTFIKNLVRSKVRSKSL